MSKLDLSAFEDKDMVPSLLTAITEAYRTSTTLFPVALIITAYQADQFFFANNERMTNFKGIPLEIKKNADETATVVRTISGILAGLHISRAKDVADVYSMLESMKVKLEAKKGE